MGHRFGIGIWAGSLLLAALVAVPVGAAESTFVRGDTNGDGDVGLEDAVGLLNYLFVPGTPEPPCLSALDVDDDGGLNIVDPIFSLDFQFVPGSPPLSLPYPLCGIDPTPDDLSCAGPLTGCFPKDEGPDFQFDFIASDDLEATVGVYVPFGEVPVDAGNFEELKLGFQPVTLELLAAAAGSDVELSASGPGVQLFRTDGTELVLPATVPGADLPLDLLVNGTATGTFELTALATQTGQLDVALLRVGRFPGLAGGALPQYPYFEFVRAIHDNDVVETAIDPGRHAERVGLDFDIYVVEHKTPAEWAADNSLVDVTGGTESGSVGDTSILGQITTVWDSGLDGGDLVGQGYDVVFDFGQDGQLDPGDLVDGLDYDEAGFHVMKNLNLAGPYPVTSFFYNGGSFLGQKTWYPTNLDDLGEVPLVVISHGNGHQYTWYDYLQSHLASYGYIVMSHQNNTGPGIETASTTTLTNTDEILENQATMGGGVLDGHIDSSRIVWIGHSRGGEGVVRAFDRIVDGQWNPQFYTEDSIVCISSIAPTVFNTVLQSNPHDSNYHLIAGAADGDVTGGADCPICQYLRIPQFGSGNVQVTYVQGADHNDFNCCGFQDGQGPSQIGRPAAQIVAKSYYLALAELYTQNNLAAKDYFTRMYEGFHPTGIGANVVCATQYKPAVVADSVIIDDYQQDSDIDLSSSGGAVLFDVTNVFEARLNDLNSSFAWTPSDPMNGMTQASQTVDPDFGVVFDWTIGDESFYELEVLPDLADFSGHGFLSFRACQGTRHPQTNALAGTLDFTVSLRDSQGNTASVNFANYGSVTRPYLRTGLGGGSGWANEYNTVRIRLADFENDFSGLDLSDVVAIRFDFGGIYGSARGRIGLDDVMITQE